MTQHRRPLSTQTIGVTERLAFVRRKSNSTKHSKFLVPVLATIVAAAFAASPAYAAGNLELMPNPPTLVLLLIFFVLLIFPLNSLIFRPLFRVLDDRDGKISGATRDAENLVSKATELMNEYRGKIREARDDAETSRREQLESARSEQSSITADAKAEAEDEIQRARTEIGQSLDEARATIEAASRDVAKSAAERILGRSLR